MADDIARWLEELGLGQYAHVFADNDIEFKNLPRLTEDDLKELGLSIGHRRTLQAAIEALPTDKPPDSAISSEKHNAAQGAEPERRQVTVMFCDLVGSTALSTRLDPEDMRELLRAYQDHCSGVIGRYGGYVAKFMGDGVLAYFGYPQAHEDDAERAIYSGLGIITEITNIDADRDETPGLAVRVGVSTGTVVIGDIVGEAAAQEATIIGETPNLAARLQEHAQPNSVVIGAETHRLAGALFECTDLGPQNFKGFDESTNVWSVRRARRAESRFDAARAAGVTKLVGRDEEIEMLLRRWRRATDGDGEVVLIAGEPGIGKSRLLRALRDHLGGEPYTPVRLQCSPFHTNSALYPMIDQLERAAGFGSGDSTSEKLDKLEALLSLPGNPINEAVPLIASMLSIPADDRYGHLSMGPNQQKEMTLRLMTDRLLANAAMRTLLFVLEDAHWSDPTTLELMHRFIDQVPEAPVMVVITYRPEFSAPWVGKPRVTQLSLNRLDRGHCALMCQTVAGSEKLPDALVQGIVERTDGVPLFVEELTRVVIESPMLDDAARGEIARDHSAELDIPSTLKDSLEARLDRMGAAKEVAQTASVIGREFDFGLLEAVAASGIGLENALDRLEKAELIFRRGTAPNATYTFKHALIQDTAYSSLLRGRRTELHGAIAKVLQASFPGIANAQPELLAHHYTEAGLFDQAVECWLQAGQVAIGRSAMAEAIANSKRGLDVIDHVAEGNQRRQTEATLYATLALAYISTVGIGSIEAGESFRRAYDVGHDISNWQFAVPVIYGLARVLYARGDIPEAYRRSKELLELADMDADLDSRIAALLVNGQSRLILGESGEAAALFEQALALYDPDHPTPPHKYIQEFGVAVRFNLAAAKFVLGYPDGALEYAQTAFDLARAKNPINLVSALGFGSFSLVGRGDVEAAAEWAEECASISEAQGFPMQAALARLVKGWTDVQFGHLDAGIADLKQGLSALEEVSFFPYYTWYQNLLAGAYLRIGDANAALELAEDALERIKNGGMHQFESISLCTKGDALREVETFSNVAAENCYLSAIDIARAQSSKSWELGAATRLARLWRSQGKTAEVRDLLAPVYGWFTEGFDTTDLKEARALLDELSYTQ